MCPLPHARTTPNGPFATIDYKNISEHSTLSKSFREMSKPGQEDHSFPFSDLGEITASDSS